MTTSAPPERDQLLWLTLEHLEHGQQRLEAQVQRLVPLLETIIAHLTAQQERPAAPIAPYAALYPVLAEPPEPLVTPSPPVARPGHPAARRGVLRSRWTQSIAVVALVLLGALPWYRLNVTASAPRGVWLRAAVPAVVERGMWVTLPAPASVKPWAPSWAHLLKQVAAVAGDQVCVSKQTLLIRGRSYGPVAQHGAHGEPLPHLGEGCLTVEHRKVFLANQTPQSLDSRYFSTVPIELLTAVMTPLWVWK